MKNTLMLLDDKAREAILHGVRTVYEPVRRTLGPSGSNVLLWRTYNRGPRITNDGVTVAECISPKNPFLALAAGAFKEMCKRTNEKSGDGTTTTAVIGGKLLEDTFKQLRDTMSEFTSGAKVNPMELRAEILRTAKAVKERIRKEAIKIETLEELERIAIVSVEDEELGKTIAALAWEVGTDGYIDVVEGYKDKVEVEINRGMRFAAKVPAKVFVNNAAKYEMIAQDANVLITNWALDNAAVVAPTFQHLSRTTTKLIVMAPSFSDNVLVNMLNATKGGYHIYPVAVPSLRTEQLEDIAVYCGANVIDKNTGRKFENVQPRDLGFLGKLIVKDTEVREDAVATEGKGEEEAKKRVETLKGQRDETREHMFKEQLNRRIASLASAVGVIRVGASSQAESLYKKLKVEDATYACRAALRGGYVKGGGLALKTIAESLDEDNILRGALMAPYLQIQENAGKEIEIGDDVIDPADAVYYAVEHATSVVAHLATVRVIIPEEPEYSPVEGETRIAEALREGVRAWKKHLGQLKDSEDEAEKDRNLAFERVLFEDR